jgi:putative transposase
MRKSKFTDAQIVAILHEAEAGMAVAQLLRRHGISRPMFVLWKQQFGGAGVPELQRLKALEQENAKLKWMYADQALELVAIKWTGKPFGPIFELGVSPRTYLSSRRSSGSRSKRDVGSEKSFD